MPKLKGTPIGENLTFTMEADGVGCIRFDTAYRGARSVTGKSVRVFSTEGNKTAPELPIKLGLNGYVPVTQ